VLSFEFGENTLTWSAPLPFPRRPSVIVMLRYTRGTRLFAIGLLVAVLVPSAVILVVVL